MPDTQHLRPLPRRTLRAAMTGIYLLLSVAGASVVVDADGRVVALVGLNASVTIAALTGVAGVLCAFGHASQLWLLERAALPFALVGAAAYATLMWARTDHLTNAATPALVTIASLALLIRLVQLEVFARQHPRPRKGA